jgi:hypothetical protein
MGAVTIPCGVCPSEIGFGMNSCPGCGRPVTDRDGAVLQVRLEGGDHQAHERGKKVRQASRWIGVLAILFAVAGPLLFATQKMETDKALAHLSEFEDGEQLEPIHGKTYTAGELRKEVEREPYRVLIVSLILAGLMAVLWIWARREPLPAIGCALALFVVVQVVGGVIEPSSIYQGIFIKVLALAALGKGLKAALAARAAMQRPGT